MLTNFFCRTHVKYMSSPIILFLSVDVCIPIWQGAESAPNTNHSFDTVFLFPCVRNAVVIAIMRIAVMAYREVPPSIRKCNFHYKMIPSAEHLIQVVMESFFCELLSVEVTCNRNIVELMCDFLSFVS